MVYSFHEFLTLLQPSKETPMYSWDHEGNPQKSEIEVEGSVVRSPDLRRDFVNVLTREPMRSGMHYYEFVLHQVVVGFLKFSCKVLTRWTTVRLPGFGELEKPHEDRKTQNSKRTP